MIRRTLNGPDADYVPQVFGAPFPMTMNIDFVPRFMWDVGASEQDITNVMEGIGGRGGYGSLSPPFMGWYGTPEDDKVGACGMNPVEADEAKCGECGWYWDGTKCTGAPPQVPDEKDGSEQAPDVPPPSNQISSSSVIGPAIGLVACGVLLYVMAKEGWLE